MDLEIVRHALEQDTSSLNTTTVEELKALRNELESTVELSGQVVSSINIDVGLQTYTDEARPYLSSTSTYIGYTWSLWVALLVLVAVSTVPLFVHHIPPIRSLCMTMAVLLGILVFVILFATSTVVYPTTIVLSDICVQPRQLIESQLSNDTDSSSSILRHYALCDSPTSGEINERFDEIDDRQRIMGPLAEHFLDDSADGGNPVLYQDALDLQANLTYTQKQTNATRFSLECTHFKRILVDSHRELCDPVIQSLFIVAMCGYGFLLVLPLYMSLVWNPCWSGTTDSSYYNRISTTTSSSSSLPLSSSSRWTEYTGDGTITTSTDRV
jgi:hypothetical protein